MNSGIGRFIDIHRVARFLDRISSPWLVAVVSMLVGLGCYYLFPLAGDSDSTTYVDFARFLYDGVALTPSYHRWPGFPFLIVLSGYFHHGSFLPLIWIQTAMAISLPVIWYVTLVPFSRVGALVFALVGIASLVPYANQMAIMTETFFLFSLSLGVLFALRFFLHGTFRSFWLSAFFLVVLGFIRANSFICLALFLGIAVIMRGDRKRAFAHAAGVVAVTAGALFAWQNHRCQLGRQNGKAEFCDGQAMTGKLLFYNAYLGANVYKPNDGRPVLDPSLGPATRSLIETSIHYLKSHAGHLKFFWGADEAYLEAAGREPERIFEEYASHPSKRTYWSLWWDILDPAIGPKPADQLMMKSAFEIFERYPQALVRYILRNSKNYALLRPLLYASEYQTHDEKLLLVPHLYYYMGVYAPPEFHPHHDQPALYPLGASAKQEFEFNTIKKSRMPDFKYLLMEHGSKALRALRIAVFVALIFSLAVAVRGPMNPALIFLQLSVLAHMAVVVIFNEPQERYIIQMLPFEAMAAFIAGVQLLAWKTKEAEKEAAKGAEHV